MPSAAFRVVVEVDLAELPKAALRSPMTTAAVPGGGPAGLRRFNSSSLLQYSCLGSFEAAFAVRLFESSRVGLQAIGLLIQVPGCTCMERGQKVRCPQACTTSRT